MSLLGESPVGTTDRRQSSREFVAAPVVEWLPAPLTDTDEPVQGHLVEPGQVRAGDYLLEYHSNGTASWLLVSSAVVIEGRLEIWYGRGVGAHIQPVPGLQLWVLRQDEAQAILRGRPLASDMTQQEIDVAFAHVLRFASLDDVVSAWRLEHEADDAEGDMGGAR